MTRWRQAALGLALLVALQVGAWGIYRAVDGKRGAESLTAGFDYEPIAATPMPDILMERADGRPVHLQDYAGEAVILHFWATWCLPCRTELPRLIALANSLEQRSLVRVVLLSVDEDWAPINHFFGGNVPAQVMRDPTARGKQAYGVTTLPDTYVLRQRLLAVARIRGARDWGSGMARDSLHQLLGFRNVEKE